MHYITDPECIANYNRLYQPWIMFSFDILPYIKIAEFDINELILADNQTPNYFYYLLEGSAKLYLTHPNGRVSLINFMNAPCFIGEMELIGAQSTSNSVKAISRCLCYEIDIKPIKHQLLQDSVFLLNLSLFLATKAIENTSNYSRNQIYPLENRLALYIIQTSHNGVYREKHTEASEFLGVTYRHFLFVLADLVKQGLLQKSPTGYKIISEEKLMAIAHRSLDLNQDRL